MKVVLILANSVDPDEMQDVAAVHLALHCLPKYRLGVSSIQRVIVLGIKGGLLITVSSNEGSAEPVKMHRLARVFAAAYTKY